MQDEEMKKRAADLIERYAKAENLTKWASAVLELLLKIRGPLHESGSDAEETSRKN